MAIKATLCEADNTHQEKPFPKLMLSPYSNYILLMINENEGTVVWSKYQPFSVGFFVEIGA